MNVLGTIQALFAIVPAVVLLVMIYKMDKVEAEPIRMIVLTFFLGVFSALPILIAEIFASDIIGWLEYTNFLGLLVYMFLGVALIEEFFKLCAAGPAYKSKHFNYTFDGVVYCATAALGYACIENVLYIVGDPAWFETSIVRGLLSVPGHMCDGIFMGAFLGWAKYYSVRGQKGTSRKMLLLAMGAPILEHMIYDSLCQLPSQLPLFAWGILVYVIAFVAVMKTWKQNDKPIYPPAGQTAPGMPANTPSNWQNNPVYYNNPRHPYQQPASQYGQQHPQQPPFQG